MTTPPAPCGLLTLDKPSGMTSRDAVNAVQRLLRRVKLGHAGTLDPLATGVLLVLVGPATRLVSHAQQLSKRYVARFRFGVRSETDDTEGELISLPNAPGVTRSALEAVLPDFTGRIAQIPPAYSAVHVAGERAYRRARRGERVELSPREVDVHELRLINFDEPAQVGTFDILCGSGTYIRSLGRDIAARLETAAVMTALERLAIGEFRVEEGVSLAGMTPAILLARLQPPESLFPREHRLECDEGQLTAIRHGRPAACTGLFSEDRPLALMHGGRMVAVGRWDAEHHRVRPVIVFPE